MDGLTDALFAYVGYRRQWLLIIPLDSSAFWSAYFLSMEGGVIVGSP